LHRIDPGIAESVTASTFGCEVIAENGSKNQANMYVEPAASGEIITATAMTEPRGGSDFANIETDAARDGAEYVLNGDKVFITNGSLADAIVVYTRTDDADPPHRGISAFVVESDNSGVDQTKMEGYLGPSTVDIGQVFLNDVRVPVKARIGEEDQAFYYAMETMNQSRLDVAASAISAARGALNRAIACIKDRDAFGQTVAKYQSVRHRLADLETRLQAARSLTYETAREMEDGALESGQKPAMAKLFASELCEEVASEAIQLHGGYGVFAEYRVESFFRWTKATQIYDGTSAIMREVIADDLLS
jgi:alkylation response protein AidB-like acyl-CoA dehydrogenase